MGVKILKREYGNAFAPIEEVKPDWLIGNTGDWLRLNMQVEAGIDFLATQEEPLAINKEERSIKLMNGGKWGNYGFDLGNLIKFSYNISTTNEEGIVETDTVIIDLEIEQLFNDTIIYVANNDINVVPYENIPTERGNVRVFSVKIYSEQEIEGVRLKYANIENSEAQNHTLTSFIDGTETEAIYTGLNTNEEGWRDMKLIGLQSGMSIKSVKIKKKPNEVLELFERFYNTSKPILNLEAFRASNFQSTPRLIRSSWATPLTIYPPAEPSFNDVVGNNLILPVNVEGSELGEYTTGEQSKCFYYNASEDNTKRFDLEYKFNVISTNKTDPNAHIRFVLVKYGNGSSLDFISVQELKVFESSEIFAGAELSYNDSFIKNINEGESFALAVEWNHYANNTTKRKVRLELLSTKCFVYDLSEGIATYKKKYEIEIDFMLSSFFDEITDLETLNVPSSLFNANSLTDSIKLIFLPEWNNPNVSISNDMKETERLGNTGWFNENYNGLENNFKVEELSYKDIGGTFVSGLSYGAETVVKARISGINNLESESDFKYGFIWLPKEEEQYKDKKTPFHVNTKINNHFATTAFNPNGIYPYTYLGFGTDGATMNVRNVNFSISGSDLIFEAVFSPTANFTDFFEGRPQDRKYALWLSVADKNLTTNFSDRVSLLLDVKNMDFFIPLAGSLEGVNTTFLEHPEDHLASGKENYKGFLEDDILARSFFELKKDTRLNQVILGYEVENLTTGLTYELERFTANLQNFITNTNGFQEIDFNSERGFKYAPNFNKNWVKVIKENGEGGNYQILYGSKIRWESWISRNNVPVEFFNNSLNLNGFNNNWIDYLRAGNNHKINFFILFDIEEAGVVSRYKNAFKIDFKSYDENLNLETEHKYIDDETNAVLNIGTDAETGRPLGVLLANKNTRVEILYKKLEGEWDLDNVYAVTTIEIDKGAGEFEFRQLSSIVESEVDNILIPLTGSQKLKVELITSDVIKASCLVDFTRLSPAIRYKITGRVGCFKNDNGTPISERIYEESNYETKYE